MNDINFSPDSKEICFTAVTDKVEATSTNGDLFIVPVSGGETKRITTQPGFDGNPVYSPDGKYIVYHAQLTAGYEADRWRVMLYDRASGEERKSDRDFFDRSAAEFGVVAGQQDDLFHCGKRNAGTGLCDGAANSAPFQRK